MPQPTAGTSYIYNGPRIGSGSDGINTGASVTVRELVAADVPGAHNATEDCVVIEWDAPSIGFNDDGNHEVVISRRAMSIGADSFDANFTLEG